MDVSLSLSFSEVIVDSKLVDLPGGVEALDVLDDIVKLKKKLNLSSCLEYYLEFTTPKTKKIKDGLFSNSTC